MIYFSMEKRPSEGEGLPVINIFFYFLCATVVREELLWLVCGWLRKDEHVPNGAGRGAVELPPLRPPRPPGGRPRPLRCHVRSLPCGRGRGPSGSGSGRRCRDRYRDLNHNVNHNVNRDGEPLQPHDGLPPPPLPPPHRGGAGRPGGRAGGVDPVPRRPRERQGRGPHLPRGRSQGHLRHGRPGRGGGGVLHPLGSGAAPPGRGGGGSSPRGLRHVRSRRR